MKALPRQRKRFHRSYDPNLVKDKEKMTRALMLHKEGHYEAAAQMYFELDRDHPPHWHARMMGAIILHSRANEHEEALALLRDIILNVPKWPDPRYNAGVILEGLGRFAEAEKHFRDCLALDEGYGKAWLNLGNTLLAQGDVPGCMQAYSRGLAIAPTDVLGLYNLMHPLSLLGEWDKAWELHELRWQTPGHLRDHGYPRITPPWTGAPFPPGTRLMVTDEQGVGDIIQFVRFLPILRPQVEELYCRVRNHSLRAYLATCFPDVTFVDHETFPAVHYCISLLSLVHIMGVTEATIPSAEGYLRPRWVTIVQDVRRIGLCWAGSPLHKRDATRSIPWDTIATLLDIRDAEFVSLQVGRDKPDDPRLLHILEETPSYEDTADVIASCDLVVSVDTSVLHLAAALGVPTWGLIAAAPDFRWMLHRTDSPWYRSLTLYRQETANDWPGVIQRVKQDIEGLNA